MKRAAAQFFAHLIGQLAGGTEHQRLRGNLSNDDVIQQTNAERRRFTATGFRLGAHVSPLQDGGQRGGLHRCHFGVPQFVEVGQLFGWQRQGRKKKLCSRR